MGLLRCCGMVGLYTLLKWHRPTPVQTLLGELPNARHNRGHLRLCFTDTSQCDLFIIHTKWEMTMSRCQLKRQQLQDDRLLFQKKQEDKSSVVRSTSKAASQTDNFLCQECRRGARPMPAWLSTATNINKSRPSSNITNATD